jgi:HK97 family phage prohead protease
MSKNKAPYGDVPYADPGFQSDGKARYPIDSAEHVRAAWSYINQAKNAAQYTADQVAKIKDKIKAAAAKFGIKISDDSSSGSNSLLTSAVERRYFPLNGVQVETRQGGSPTIRGYAAVFDSLSKNLGFFRERIAPGAFARSLREDDIVALFNHDPNYPLGRTSNGRLKLHEDSRGLHMQVSPTQTSYAADLVTNIRDGTVPGQSFSFTDARDKWSREDGVEVRTLTGMRILDVSPVVFPAYTATDVQVRSWVKEAGLDFEPLSAAMSRCFRGLELTPYDDELVDEAVNRIPALRSWTGVQARPRPKMLVKPQQAQWPDLQRRRRRLAAKHGHRQMGDLDDDPGSLAQAIDQTLDEALEEHAQGNDDEGWQLVTAACATVDQLLEVLNVPDSDESESEAATG